MHIIPLYMSMRGRYNFSNMARHKFFNEKSYRHQFEQEFDFQEFNTHMIESYCSDNMIAAFDPSFIRKSGKHTPHAGMFWSGCSQKSLYGLEIGCLAAIDLKHETALSMRALQTPTAKELKAEGRSMVDYYAERIIESREEFNKLKIKVLVVDGYFSKAKFINPICKNTSLHIVTKPRDDFNAKYLYTGIQQKGKGRKRTFAGKVDVKNLDKRKIKCFLRKEHEAIYAGEVYAVQLKRKVKMAYIEQLENKKATGRYAIIICTDLNLSPDTIYTYYSSRFQIEFLLRDAKQYVGLEECQARSENKLDFHFNCSLTTVSLAKAVLHLPTQEQNQTPFSMNDIKLLMFNQLFVKSILSNLGLELTSKKIKYAFDNAVSFGRKAA